MGQYHRRYEKTPKGFLMRCYRNMQSRVTGVQKKKYHLYKNKELLPREDFYDWAMGRAEFWELFAEWEKAGYPRKATPSVNRIDSAKGYTPDNMEWITHSENSRLGGKARYEKYHTYYHQGLKRQVKYEP